MNRMLKVLLCALVITSPQAFAYWDGQVTGKINAIDIAKGDNYDFRVNINGSTFCGNSNTWAYLNESDTNYKTFVSVLLAAKMANKAVTIFSNKEISSGNGYCHIGYIVLL